MNACILFFYAAASGFVTPACFVNKTTLIEPESIHHLAHAPKEFVSTVNEAPKAYINYWKKNNIKTNIGYWDPDYYFEIINNKIRIIHTPWVVPEVRKKRNHYQRYKKLLFRLAGKSGVNYWEKERLALASKHSEQASRLN